MTDSISPNTQAILLLTAPLITGKREASADLLTAGEYKRMARWLREAGHEPGDLLEAGADEILGACRQDFDTSRLKKLLDRGFLLGEAIEQWRSRAIWLMSRADPAYPRRLKARLKDDAPAVLYGCGDVGLLESGGLAVVGSRDASDTSLAYAEDIGRLAARMKSTLVSGGARGIDQAAMRGSLGDGGRATGVLADQLGRAALNRDHRELLMSGNLVLISPFDPSAGFNVGNAMQRNKLIYALADAALVVSSDYEKGGTWAGAVEQLDKLHFVPVYVRSDGETSKGLKALAGKGALPWPKPESKETFSAALAASVVLQDAPQSKLALGVRDEGHGGYKVSAGVQPEKSEVSDVARSPSSPAEELFAKVRGLLEDLDAPRSEAEIAEYLGVSNPQAKVWILRLVEEGVLEKMKKPVRYCSAKASGRLL